MTAAAPSGGRAAREVDASRSSRTPPGPRLVGRDAELAQIRQSVAQVVSGAGCAVLVTGPTGIGKTRLAHEARDLAAATGLATFESRAHELSRDVAYAPVVGAFAPMLRALDPSARSDLVGDLPQLARLFGGVGAPDLGAAAADEPDLLRIGVLDALTRMLDRLTRERPLMWLLDDVHAADTETRLLVLHLAAALPDRPVLLILASRDDEPAGDHVHVLGKALAEASWQVRRVQLRPLDDRSATLLAEAVLGRAMSPELTAAVVARGVGRPLFLESLAQGLGEDGGTHVHHGVLTRTEGELPVPADLEPPLRARLAGLTGDERSVLDAVAVAGAPLDGLLLGSVTGLSPGALDAAVRALQRRRMVVCQDAEYDAAHSLLRDVVLADLPAPTVAGLHSRLAGALSGRDPDDPRLAEHVLHGGSLVARDIALDVLVRAARRARRVGAAADARRYLSRAVQLNSDADLVAELGVVCEQLGDYPAARKHWQEALEAYASQRRTAQVARTHRLLGMLEWDQADIPAAEEHLDAAERALAGLEPGPEHGELLHVRMVTANRVGNQATLDRAGQELQRLADRLGSPALAARAHLAAASSASGRTDYLTMDAENAAALTAASDVEDPALLMRVHDQVSVAAGAAGDVATVRRHSLESLRIATEAGNPTWEPWPLVRLAFCDLLSGDLDGALRGTSEVLGYVERYRQTRGGASAYAAHAHMLVHRGRLTEARKLIDRGVDLAGPRLRADRNVFSAVAYARVVLARAEGDPVAARLAGEPLIGLGGGWLPLLAVAEYGEACVDADDEHTAQDVERRLRGVVGCRTCLPTLLADWLGGLRESRAGRSDAAAETFRRARSGFDDLGLVVAAARAALAAAEALVDCDREEAVRQAGAALAVFDPMGSPQPAQQARELLRCLGVTPSRGRARSRDASRLTARELEVARLVAAGLTNAEVATELFISPRTVTTHLDRMYARLAVSSRTALTRYLADSGLLEERETGTIT